MIWLKNLSEVRYRIFTLRLEHPYIADLHDVDDEPVIEARGASGGATGRPEISLLAEDAYGISI